MRRHIYKRKPRKCPICKSNSILNIIYGLPSYEMAEDVKADLLSKTTAEWMDAVSNGSEAEKQLKDKQ